MKTSSFTRSVMVALTAMTCVFGASKAQAQSCTANPCSVNNTASVSVPTLISLSLSSATAALTAPALSDFTAGSASITEASGPSVTIKANKVYNLSVAAAAANWTAGLGASGYSKPASDLSVKLGSGSWFSLSTTAQDLITSGARTNTTTTGLLYKTAYSFTLDAPDSYSLAVTYTIAAP